MGVGVLKGEEPGVAGVGLDGLESEAAEGVFAVDIAEFGGNVLENGFLEVFLMFISSISS